LNSACTVSSARASCGKTCWIPSRVYPVLFNQLQCLLCACLALFHHTRDR
jgi:hypothetical protein